MAILLPRQIAREAVANAVGSLGLRGVLEVLAAHAQDTAEAMLLDADKLDRYRWASDHRCLINVLDKLHH